MPGEGGRAGFLPRLRIYSSPSLRLPPLTGRYTICSPKIAIAVPAGSLPGVFFGGRPDTGSRYRCPLEYDPVLGKQSFFFANPDGILSGTVNAILSYVHGSYAITSFIVGPGNGKISNHKFVSEIITYPRADRARSSSSPGQTRPCSYGTTPGCPRRRDFYQAIYIHSSACVYQKRDA